MSSRRIIRSHLVTVSTDVEVTIEEGRNARILYPYRFVTEAKFVAGCDWITLALTTTAVDVTADTLEAGNDIFLWSEREKNEGRHHVE